MLWMTDTSHRKLAILSSILFHKSLHSGCNAFKAKLIASYGSQWKDRIIEVDQMD